MDWDSGPARSAAGNPKKATLAGVTRQGPRFSVGLAHERDDENGESVNGRPPRRAGSPWRILVHEWLGRKGSTLYGRQFDVGNDPSAPARGAETSRRLNALRPDLEPTADGTGYTVLEGTEFDELVIGRWIHLEQQDSGLWWMSIGGVVVNVTADRDGRPKRVDVFGPDDYDGRQDGCAYSIAWSGEENRPGSSSAMTGLTSHCVIASPASRVSSARRPTAAR